MILIVFLFSLLLHFGNAYFPILLHLEIAHFTLLVHIEIVRFSLVVHLETADFPTWRDDKCNYNCLYESNWNYDNYHRNFYDN